MSSWTDFRDSFTGRGDRSEARRARRQEARFREQQLEIMREQLALAKAEDARMQEEYQRRLGISNQMMEDAVLTPEELDEGVTKASTDVRQAISRNRQSMYTNLSRYGINPGGNKFSEMNKDIGIQGALAEAGARNQTRTYLQEKEKDDIARARATSLGLPYSPPSRAIGVMGSQAGMYGNTANYFGNSARYYDQSANQAVRETTRMIVNGINAGMNASNPGAGGGGGIPSSSSYYSSSYVPPGGSFPSSNMYPAQYYDPNNAYY